MDPLLLNVLEPLLFNVLDPLTPPSAHVLIQRPPSTCTACNTLNYVAAAGDNRVSPNDGDGSADDAHVDGADVVDDASDGARARARKSPVQPSAVEQTVGRTQTQAPDASTRSQTDADARKQGDANTRTQADADTTEKSPTQAEVKKNVFLDVPAAGDGGDSGDSVDGALPVGGDVGGFPRRA